MTLVFVYGSLKRGFGNSSLLSGSEYVGEAETVNKYQMVSLYAFPGVIKSKELSTIKGELYLVSDEILNSLNRLEGHPNFYNAQKVACNFNNNIVQAIMYFLTDEEKYETHSIIDSGVWQK